MEHITFEREIQQLRNELKDDLADYVERLRAENEALRLELGLLEAENKLWRDSLCKIKADAIREYANNQTSGMNAVWALAYAEKLEQSK